MLRLLRVWREFQCMQTCSLSTKLIAGLRIRLQWACQDVSETKVAKRSGICNWHLDCTCADPSLCLHFQDFMQHKTCALTYSQCIPYTYPAHTVYKLKCREICECGRTCFMKRASWYHTCCTTKLVYPNIWAAVRLFTHPFPFLLSSTIHSMGGPVTHASNMKRIHDNRVWKKRFDPCVVRLEAILNRNAMHYAP